MTREERNKYMKDRRARLAKEGTCVDCQQNEVKPPDPVTKKRHVLCDACCKARTERLAANKRQGALFTEATL